MSTHHAADLSALSDQLHLNLSCTNSKIPFERTIFSELYTEISKLHESLHFSKQTQKSNLSLIDL
jgi:hypothetical protein